MISSAGNSKNMKKINRINILNLIRKKEPISRQELVYMTGLTPAAITGIVRELLDKNLVKETGLGKSKGGRRPIKLKVNSKARYVIGVEVTRSETTIGIADLKNKPKHIKTLEIDMTVPELGLDKLVSSIKEVLGNSSNSNKNFIAIGVAFPGLINMKDMTITRSINLGPNWRKIRIKDEIQTKIGLPVFVENNSNAAVLAERCFGENSKDLVYINLGEGISAGIILEDKVLHGNLGYAGEIGHMVIAEDGPLCNCGNRGCLESLCSVPALLRKVNYEIQIIDDNDPIKKTWQKKGKISLKDLMNCSKEENSYAYKLLKQVAYYTGLAVANVINFYNPSSVIIGGKLSPAVSKFINIIKETAKSHAFPEVVDTATLKISQLRNKTSVIGACSLALRGIFNSPESPIFND